MGGQPGRGGRDPGGVPPLFREREAQEGWLGLNFDKILTTGYLCRVLQGVGTQPIAGSPSLSVPVCGREREKQ